MFWEPKELYNEEVSVLGIVGETETGFLAVKPLNKA